MDLFPAACAQSVKVGMYVLQLKFNLYIHLGLEWFQQGAHFFRQEPGNLKERSEKNRANEIMNVCEFHE